MEPEHIGRIIQAFGNAIVATVAFAVSDSGNYEERARMAWVEFADAVETALLEDDDTEEL